MCDDSLWSDYDGYYENDDGEPRPTTCTRCGATNLIWTEVFDGCHDFKWRLFEGTKPHVCRMSDDEFEDLT